MDIKTHLQNPHLHNAVLLVYSLSSTTTPDSCIAFVQKQTCSTLSRSSSDWSGILLTSTLTHHGSLQHKLPHDFRSKSHHRHLHPAICGFDWCQCCCHEEFEKGRTDLEARVGQGFGVV